MLMTVRMVARPIMPIKIPLNSVHSDGCGHLLRQLIKHWSDAFSGACCA